MKLTKWIGQCKDHLCIGFHFKSAEVLKLPMLVESVLLEHSSIENVRSSATSLPPPKFYPSPDEIFRQGGKDDIARYSQDASSVNRLSISEW